tara:strand:+ start:4393 stop:5142 length:750 start_codon:yes stop_codon:yes gene_type:complete
MNGILRSLFFSIITVMALPALVQADQFLKAADNATLNGVMSKSEVTRISFTGDDAASIQKIKPTNPLDDFSVAHDPVTGDIYVTLPVGFSSKFVNFFATSKRGFTYKFVLRVSDIPATQIFVQNPVVGSQRAAQFEREQPYLQTLVKIIRAMWNREVLPGYEIIWQRQSRIKAGSLRYRQIGLYDGSNLVGRVYEVENSSAKPVRLSEGLFETGHILAVSIKERSIAPKSKTTVFVILRRLGGYNNGQQ